MIYLPNNTHCSLGFDHSNVGKHLESKGTCERNPGLQTYSTTVPILPGLATFGNALGNVGGTLQSKNKI